MQDVALEVIFRGKSPKLLVRRLTSLVQRLDTLPEGSLDTQGRPQLRKVSWCGALVIELLEEINAAAGQAWPELPSVGEVLNWYWPVHPPQNQEMPSLELLQERLARLSQLDLHCRLAQIQDPNLAALRDHPAVLQV